MSSRSAAVAAFAGFLAACATAIPLIKLSAKSAMRILVMNFLVIVVSLLHLFGNLLLFFSCFEAGSLGFGFRHEFSLLGLAIPAPTLVVDAAIGVDPDLT